MKKMKIVKNLFTLVLTLGILASAALPAYAEQADSGESDASITFTPNEGPTKPVDPEEPGEEEEDGEEVNGSLAIVKVTPFVFESAKISNQDESYPLDVVKPNIQIVDLRGTNAGWSLTASLTGFTDEDNEASLLGSSIIFHDGRPNSVTSMTYAPEPNKGAEAASDGSPATVLRAKKGDGGGLWVNRWYPDTTGDQSPLVTLFVPAGTATTGKHTATINWILYDTP